MSFKFNFSHDDDNKNDLDAKKPRLNEPVQEAIEINVSDWKELEDSDVEEATLDEIDLDDGTCLVYVQAQLAEQRVKESNSSKLNDALVKQSDLVPHVYEGGLKIWECSIDLVNHLTSLDIAFRGMKVLELGCGAALPGLYALVNGATTHFQDYNKEVINYITIPNVIHNLNRTEKTEKARAKKGSHRFFAGDWSKVSDLLTPELKSDDKYDLILTSETIYSPDNYSKLHDTMRALLKPSGVIYLAAKTYYFGVGGGLREFEEKVKEWGVFSSKSCRQFDQGVQREILEMKFVESAPK